MPPFWQRFQRSDRHKGLRISPKLPHSRRNFPQKQRLRNHDANRARNPRSTNQPNAKRRHAISNNQSSAGVGVVRASATGYWSPPFLQCYETCASIRRVTGGTSMTRGSWPCGTTTSRGPPTRAPALRDDHPLQDHQGDHQAQEERARKEVGFRRFLRVNSLRASANLRKQLSVRAERASGFYVAAERSSYNPIVNCRSFRAVRGIFGALRARGVIEDFGIRIVRTGRVVPELHNHSWRKNVSSRCLIETS